MAERGVEVDHVTVYRWMQRFTPLFADAARVARHQPGDRWFVDETYVEVAGVWRYIYRAVDQHGQVIDVLVSKRRDGQAVRRFFQLALTTLKVRPTEVVTDAAPVYPRVLDDLVPSAWHHVEQHENNRIGSRMWIAAAGAKRFGADSVLATVSRMRAAVRPGESDFDEWIYLGAAPIKATRVSAPT